MIILEKVSCHIPSNLEFKEILRETSILIPSNATIAVLGSSDADRKSLMDLLAGVRMPSSGRIRREAMVSFPLGSLGGFSDSHSVYENVAHASRLYGADPKATIELVHSFAGHNIPFKRRLGRLSRHQRTMLSCVVGLCLPFDIYIWNMTGKWARSSESIRKLIEMRMRNHGLIVATGDEAFVRSKCDMAILLRNKRLRLFERVDGALAKLKASI